MFAIIKIIAKVGCLRGLRVFNEKKNFVNIGIFFLSVFIIYAIVYINDVELSWQIKVHCIKARDMSKKKKNNSNYP